MSNENITIGQNGGVTRVQHGAQVLQAIAAPAAPDSSRVSSGATRMTLGEGGEVTQQGTTRYSAGQDMSTTSIAATLQRIRGVDTVQLIPGFEGSRTDVRTALAEGLIENVEGAGRYRDKTAASEVAEGAAEPTNETAPEGAPDDPGADVFSPQEDSEWAEVIEPLPQHSFDAAAASVAVAVLSGSDNLHKAAIQLAESAGISPEQAAFYVTEGHNLHERIVARESAAMGVTDKENFYRWCRQSKGSALQHAIQSLAQGRDVAPFRVLAVEYVRHTSPAAKELRSRMS